MSGMTLPIVPGQNRTYPVRKVKRFWIIPVVQDVFQAWSAEHKFEMLVPIDLDPDTFGPGEEIHISVWFI